ncbi:MAG: hypothetical protein ACMG6E_09275, partial [Candidatus Roizmanbacteria bacterium]
MSYKIWSIRSGDWYNSERRIIFAARTKKERSKWIKFFKGEGAKINVLNFKKLKPTDDNIIGLDLSPDYEQEILDLRLSGTKVSGFMQSANALKTKKTRKNSEFHVEEIHFSGGEDKLQEDILRKKKTRSFSIDEKDELLADVNDI